MEFLSRQEKLQLQQILINNTLLKFSDPDFRSALLSNSGLGKYCSILSLDKPLVQFVISLCAKLSEVYVIVDNSERLGLIVFLEYIHESDPTLSPEDNMFIKLVVSKWEYWYLSKINNFNDRNFEQLSFVSPQATITIPKDSIDINKSHVQEENFKFVIEEVNLKECLKNLGVHSENILNVSEWVIKEATQQLEGSKAHRYYRSIEDYLATLNEPNDVCKTVQEFLENLLKCMMPEKLLGSNSYVSTQKINQMYRAYRLLIRQHLSTVDVIADDCSEDKFLLLHKYLYQRGQILYLPARLLSGYRLPSGTDYLSYFIGKFNLNLDESFFKINPKLKQIIENQDIKNLPSLVTEIFQNSDPFLYPLIHFDGWLGCYSVSMILSRKYFNIGSMTMIRLCDALEKKPIVLAGFARLQNISEERCEVQPLVCEFSSANKLVMD